MSHSVGNWMLSFFIYSHFILSLVRLIFLRNSHTYILTKVSFIYSHLISAGLSCTLSTNFPRLAEYPNGDSQLLLCWFVVGDRCYRTDKTAWALFIKTPPFVFPHVHTTPDWSYYEFSWAFETCFVPQIERLWRTDACLEGWAYVGF